MTRAKSTAADEVVLNEAAMNHIGVHVGDEIEVRLLPGGKVEISAPPARQKTGVLDAFFGSLKRSGQTVRTLQEIEGAVQTGWEGRVKMNDRD